VKCLASALASSLPIAGEESFKGCTAFILREELLRMEKLKPFQYLIDGGFLNYLIAYYKRWHRMV